MAGDKTTPNTSAVRWHSGAGGLGCLRDKTPPNTPTPSYSAFSAVRPACALARSDATPTKNKLTYYYNGRGSGGEGEPGSRAVRSSDCGVQLLSLPLFFGFCF